MPERKFVSVGTAADRYDYTQKRIRQLIDRGLLTGYRFDGGNIRIDLAELDQLFQPIRPAQKSTAGGAS